MWRLASSIFLTNPLNGRNQSFITPGTGAAQIRVPFSGSMATVTRRGDLHDFANRLDPKGVTIRVNKPGYHAPRS